LEMNKSGQQGLSFVKQQKVLAAIERSKKVEKITMLDIHSIHLGKPIELTYNQCKKIDAWLDEKEEMIYNRFNNKIELKRLKAMKVGEKDRMRMHESIEKGENMINKQTRAISKLSINSIAMRLKMPYERIEYYANKKRYVE